MDIYTQSSFQRASSRICLAILLSCLAAACSGPAQTSRVDAEPLPSEALRTAATGSFGGSARYSQAGEPGSFNPVLATNVRDLSFGRLLHAYLFEFDPIERKMKGGVVLQSERADGGASLILTLRRRVRFSDGEPLTAAHVVSTFERIFDEESANPLKDSLTLDGKPVTATRVDDQRVEISSGEPYAAAEYILGNLPILPTHRLDPEKTIDSYWGLDADPDTFVGLGPFVMVRHEPGQRTVLKNNPHYWRTDTQGQRLPFLDQLVVEYVPDRNTQLLRFQSGELDLVDTQLRPEDYQLLAELEDSRFQLFDAGPSNNLYLFWLNLSSGSNADGQPLVDPKRARWFANADFRRALNSAISRESIVENVFLGNARPAWSLLPEVFDEWGTDQLVRYPHDLQRARRYLREGGFSWRQSSQGEVLVDDRGEEVSLNILTRSDDIWGRIAAVLQQDLEQLGMRVTITQEEFRAVISRITRSRNYDAALLALTIPPDPSDHGNVLLSASPMHFWNPAQASPATPWEERIDELMMSQMRSIDRQQRIRQYAEIQHIVSDQVALMPLINSNILVAAQARLQNLSPAPIFPPTLWNSWALWVEP